MSHQTFQAPKPISREIEEYLKTHFAIVDGRVLRVSTMQPAEHPANGYWRVRVKGRNLAAHHIVWLFEHGAWPQQQLDHINRIKTDNRPENLRLASNSVNMLNRGLQRNNSSGIKNVSWHKQLQRWRADVRRNGMKHHLGLFDTKEDAAMAVANYLRGQ